MAARRSLILSGALMSAFAGAWMASAIAPAPAAAQAPSNDPISERLAALEKALIRNPDNPRDTVLARLGAIEQLLQQQAKADEQQTGHAKKTVDAAAAEQERLDRRLKILENNAAENARNDLAEQLRDLKKDLTGLNQSIKQISDRVRKLEQRL